MGTGGDGLHEARGMSRTRAVDDCSSERVCDCYVCVKGLVGFPAPRRTFAKRSIRLVTGEERLDVFLTRCFFHLSGFWSTGHFIKEEQNEIKKENEKLHATSRRAPGVRRFQWRRRRRNSPTAVSAR